MAKRKSKPKPPAKKVAAPKPKGVGGRPSKYTPALLEKICDRLSKGEPLARICRDEGMPHPSTVRDWADANREVSRRIARAREDGHDAIAQEAMDIADNIGFEGRDTIETQFGEIPNKEWILRSKLRVDTRLKLLAKWDPKRYGDKLDLSGDPERPVTINLNLDGKQQ